MTTESSCRVVYNCSSLEDRVYLISSSVEVEVLDKHDTRLTKKSYFHTSYIMNYSVMDKIWKDQLTAHEHCTVSLTVLGQCHINVAWILRLTMNFSAIIKMLVSKSWGTFPNSKTTFSEQQNNQFIYVIVAIKGTRCIRLSHCSSPSSSGTPQGYVRVEVADSMLLRSYGSNKKMKIKTKDCNVVSSYSNPTMIIMWLTNVFSNSVLQIDCIPSQNLSSYKIHHTITATGL